MKTRDTIIIVVAVLAIIYGAFSFITKPAVAPGLGDIATTTTEIATTTAPTTAVKKTTTPKTTTVPTKIGAYTVSYTDKGFNPSTIEIKVGSTVQFINNSSREMSVASAGIGGFGAMTMLNQQGSVKRGGIFNATFTGVGAWNYMNRLWQGDKGTIVVK